MSEATLRALVSIVLSSAAIPRVRFRVEGYHLYSDCFSRLKASVRNGGINLTIDDAALAKAQASAAYNSSRDLMILHSSMVKSTAISAPSRASIIHECLHAILDMDHVESLSPYEEETCAALVSSIYCLNHFGKPFFKPHGNATKLAKLVTKNPGMDITGEDMWWALYGQVADIYAASDPTTGRTPNIHNGLRKTV